MPAYPQKIAVTTGNQTVYIRLFGDEHNKRAESLDGHTIIQKNNIWYYAEKDDNGYLKPTKYALSEKQGIELKDFLKNTPLHIQPTTNSDNQLTSRTRSNNSKAVIGERRILVILMQFKDLSLTKEQEDFNRLFNEPNYKEDNAYGSVYDYYHASSYGKLELKCDIIGPFTSMHERAYYGGNELNGNDKNPEALFEEAIKKAISVVNLKDYDSDNDGYVDNIHIIFAGHGEEAGASSDAIWSHEIRFYNPYEFQGLLVDRYSCAPELRGNSGQGISRIGAHCHEIGHAFGAMDYYDTNYSEQGKFEGTGDWDIMASGSWNEDGIIPADFNPYVKMADFGWIEIPEMPEKNLSILPSNESEHNYYRISNSTNDYYLIENRSNDYWGKGLPGSGLLIYHIHPNITNVGNEINTTYPQKCYPVCASSTYAKPNSNSSSYGDINSPGCPFPGSTNKKQFGTATIPCAFSWDGGHSNIDIRDISVNSEGIITLNNLSKTENYEEEIIINEDFESSPNISIESNTGDAQWTWFQIDQSQKDKSDIEAHSGIGYLRFQPGKMSQGKLQSSVIITTPKSNTSDYAYLSLYYYGKSYRTDIKVMDIAVSNDDSEWENTSIFGNGKSEWKYFEMALPAAKSYKIEITGYASYGQSILIDDLSINKKIATSILRNETTNKQQEIIIYDITGRKRSRMMKGLNIVRDKNGNTKKVFNN